MFYFIIIWRTWLTYFIQLCYRIVQKIHKNLPEKTLTIEECPNLDLDGKDSKKINPALELIKSVCKVFEHEYEYVRIILRGK